MGENCDEKRREPVIHRMTRRCSVHDYRERCIYQITLVLADRASMALGRLEIVSRGESPEEVEARVVPSELGAACPVPAAPAVGVFMALGNRFLLGRALRQVQVSRLAQLIAGPGAAEINYHGARLADVDRLATEAVKAG